MWIRETGLPTDVPTLTYGSSLRRDSPPQT